MREEKIELQNPTYLELPTKDGNQSKCYYYYYKSIQNKMTAVFDKYLNQETINKYKRHKMSDKPAKGSWDKIYDESNIFAFDTETSTVMPELLKTVDGSEAKHPIAFVYTWQFCINSRITIIGRTVQEFQSFLFDIINYYKSKLKVLNESKFRLPIWVHNLSYDFHFLLEMNDFNPENVLSRKSHDVITADLGIFEFKDSYSLLGTSLDSASKDYGTLHRKMKGDLKYVLIRNELTNLTKKELGYIVGDVVVLAELILILYNLEGYGVKTIKGKTSKSFKNFGPTKTSLVRAFIRKLLAENQSMMKECERINKLCYLNVDTFNLLYQAYSGGYTQAFFTNKGKVLENVASFDITSDYPYQMIVNKFPMSTFKPMTSGKMNLVIDDDGHIKSRYRETRNYLIVVDLYHIKAKTNLSTFPCYKLTDIPESDIPEDCKDNKCFDGSSVVKDCHKVYECVNKRIVVPDTTYEDILTDYDCDLEIIEMYEAKSDYLPTYMTEANLEYYSQKTTLKGVEGEELKYQYFKQLLNSIYGCTVQNPLKELILLTYEKDWEKGEARTDEESEEILNNKRRFNQYQWGVWVTAYARSFLLRMLRKIDPSDLVYCDTDSCKFIFREEYREAFEEENKRIHELNLKMIKERGLDINKVMPKNNKGKVKEIGLWDFEGIYAYFKTTGAKRYFAIVNHDGRWDLEITCAGIAKQSLKDYVLGDMWHLTKDENGNYPSDFIKENATEILDSIQQKTLYNDGIDIEAGWKEDGISSKTGKMTHTYYSLPDEFVKEYYVTDYQGHTSKIAPKYFITLEPARFTLNENTDLCELADKVNDRFSA